jgi:hypothetical protein
MVQIPKVFYKSKGTTMSVHGGTVKASKQYKSNKGKHAGLH